MTNAHLRNGSSYQSGGSVLEEASLSEVFRQTLSFLRRHMTLILLLGFAFAVVTIVVTQRIERLYKSSVMLMIEPPAQSPIEAETATFLAVDTEYVDGQILLIKADDTLIKVVQSGNLAEIPYFQVVPPNIALRSIYKIKKFILGSSSDNRVLPEGAPSRETLNAKSILSEVLTVDREGDTNVINISVRANSPVLAQRTTSLVAKTYVDVRLAQRRRDAREFSDWINVRAEVLREQVTQAEEAVTAYRIQNRIFNEVGSASLNDQQLTEFNAELIRSRTDLAQKKASLARARGVLKNSGDILSLPEVQNSEIITELRSQLLLLELRERDLSASSNKSNPRLTQVRQQYEAMSRQLISEVERIVNILANEVETLESRTALLTEALLMASGQSKIETQISVGLRQLERVADAYRQHYQRYLENAGLAAELKSFTTTGTQVVTSATVPINPFYPAVKVLVIFGFILGSGAGALLGYMRDAMMPGFITASQAQEFLGHPVLASLPELDGNSDTFRETLDQPMGAFAEAIRIFRHRLVEGLGTENSPIILLTSACPAEGKTSLAAALAASAKSAGQNVLLIDADLHQRGLSRQFNFCDDPGLAEMLHTRSWSFIETNQSTGNLDVIPTGSVVNNGSDILARDSLRDYLDEARFHYDLIIIDGPPIANIADASILARLCDAVGFVVRWNETPREVVRTAMARLNFSGVAGVVLNGVDAPTMAQYGESYDQYHQTDNRSKQVHRVALA